MKQRIIETDTINDRLRAVVEKKSATRKDFAETMGWTVTYLNKMLSKGQGIGMTPIEQVMQKFPDIDARWLILGDGYMFGTIEKGIMSQAMLRLRCKKYIPVMNAEELADYLDGLNDSALDDYLKKNIDKWEEMLSLKGKNSEMFKEMLKLNGICKEGNQ